MSEKKPFYVTTTLPYVNAEPHIGFAMELIHADILARAKKLQGFEVLFNTGVDEHGSKVYTKALEEGGDTKKYVDEYATKFKDLLKLLGIDEGNLRFVRTTDDKHKQAAQEFWKLCDKAGDIYKKEYKVRYCIGCELEKTDSELVGGRCPLHPNKDLEIREEENYFFRFSKYQKLLLDFYKNNPEFVIPDFRFNEIKAFVERGLEDFSTSRLKSKMPWGVEVPGDSEHVMYVWFDALTNYVSTIGWPDNKDEFKKWWPVVQYAGKDQIRQQAAMWQAMLMSANLPNSGKIIIHGFLNFNGQKMSKSLGNFITPQEVINKFGLDAFRYFVAREFNQFEDTDVSWDKLSEAYNANLVNGLGNLTSRILKMAETHLDKAPEIPEHSIPQKFKDLLNDFEIAKATDFVWEKIGELDKRIQDTEPFKLVKTNPEEGKRIISELAVDLYTVGRMLNPLMPDANVKIKELVKANKLPEAPLFPRIEAKA